MTGDVLGGCCWSNSWRGGQRRGSWLRAPSASPEAGLQLALRWGLVGALAWEKGPLGRQAQNFLYLKGIERAPLPAGLHAFSARQRAGAALEMKVAVTESRLPQKEQL